VSEHLSVVWNDQFAQYDFGPGHPLAPVRVQLAMRLAREFEVFDQPNVDLISDFPEATHEQLARVHTPAYIDAVMAASNDPAYLNEKFGLGTADDPVFSGMHQAAARVAGGTLAAVQEVHFARTDHAVNIFGGLHHAMPDRAAGFCIYNDVGVAIAWLLDQGVERIAYVDVDVHHGDGVQEMFYNDPRVMTISIHESPRSLFPGTGWPSEVGGPQAIGSSVNIALPAGTGDQGWLRAFHGVVPQLLEAFSPQILISQHGVDSHLEDPLAHLTLSIDGQRMSYEALHRWSHAYAGGQWVAVGGGGYEWVDVVPRAWTHLMAEMSGHRINPESAIPQNFHEYVTQALGRPGPARMTDGRDPWPKPFDQGFDPDDPVDTAILATRNAVFPTWGLTVEPGMWF
jgi:acetoin utilization protein AcuC